MGTLSFADFYGFSPPNRRPGETSPSSSQKASGGYGPDESKPALFWVGMVIALVILRVAWELGE